MMDDEKEMRAPGRPRNEQMESRVLAVARALVTERGYPSVTMAMIAMEAGVAKQTLYRRWSSKAEIILQAFLESASGPGDVGYDRLRPTLERFLSGLFAHLERDGAAIRSLIASAQSDPPFLQHFRNLFIAPREAALAAILSEAVVRRELAENSDIAVLSDMIHGAFWYRLLLGETLDAAYAKRLITMVCQ
jgi:AcrR family transcriptional regulator